jgi:DNA-binding NarL/FixJ family response regulator
MPNVDGVEATRRVRAEHPGTEVVVLTTYSDDSVLSALRAGARGFLTKDADAESIGRALQPADDDGRVTANDVRWNHVGQSIVDAEVQRRLIEGAAAPKPADPADTGPTPRELEVLD